LGSTDSHCSGNAGSPTAAAGYLCIYISSTSNSSTIGGNTLEPKEPGNLNYGAATFGVILTALAYSTGTVEVVGSWAVTAP
jgi:hypothetical protein